MFGVLLSSVAALFEETSTTIGKREVTQHRESTYVLAFLSLIWGVILFAVIAVARPGSFSFSIQSLPTLCLRLILEIVQVHVTVLAITRADRSTFSFLRVGTLLLLLGIDVALGYHFTGAQVVGTLAIVAAFVALFVSRSFSTRAMGFVVLSTVNAAFTISLYKYNISHFNSVTAEQFISYAVLVTYFACLTWIRGRENPSATWSGACPLPSRPPKA